MEVYDLEGRVDVDCDKDLIHRLRSVRRGKYAAIILCHDGRDNNQPSLYIHINGDLAYLHYFPDNQRQHPGFQAKGMMAGDCEDEVRFLMTSGTEADSITMPRETLVPVEAAYKAAEEFLRKPALPPSVSWSEL